MFSSVVFQSFFKIGQKVKSAYKAQFLPNKFFFVFILRKFLIKGAAHRAMGYDMRAKPAAAAAAAAALTATAHAQKTGTFVNARPSLPKFSHVLKIITF